MRNYFFLIMLTGLFLGNNEIKAQQEVNYRLYRYHLNLINPATTGTQGGSYFNASLRSQWVGIAGAPETQAISFGTPNKKDRLGTGFSIINDKAYVENQTQLFADFSYRLQMDTDKNLYLGIKAGGTSIRIDASSLSTPEAGAADPFLQSTSSFVPNIGVGFYYKTPRYFLSASIPRLLNTERFRYDDGQVTHATDKPHLFVSTGVRFPLNDQWDFYPSAMLSYVAAAPIDLLGDVSFSFNRNFDFGAQFSISGAMGATSLIKISEGFQFGYAYTTNFQDQVNRFSNGTHELVMKIKLSAVNPEQESSFINEAEEDKSLKEKRIGTKNKEKFTERN